jgi:hypothetical protein
MTHHDILLPSNDLLSLRWGGIAIQLGTGEELENA